MASIPAGALTLVPRWAGRSAALALLVLVLPGVALAELTFDATGRSYACAISVPNNYVYASVADLNEDGLDDVVATGLGLYVMLNDGIEGFQATLSFETTLPLSRIALGDVDEDGHLDAFVTEQWSTNSMVWLFRGHGDGTFDTALPFLPGSGATDVALALLDGDSHLDLVVANDGSAGPVVTLRGHGDGTFDAPVGLPTQGTRVATGDFEGDCGGRHARTLRPWRPARGHASDGYPRSGSPQGSDHGRARAAGGRLSLAAATGSLRSDRQNVRYKVSCVSRRGALDNVSVKNPNTGLFEVVWSARCQDVPGRARRCRL